MSDSGDPPWWDTPYLEIIGEIGWESGVLVARAGEDGRERDLGLTSETSVFLT